jgi:hypothetical protein
MVNEVGEAEIEKLGMVTVNVYVVVLVKPPPEPVIVI